MRRSLGILPDTPPAVADGSKPRQVSGSDGNFDTNMVIILAALLCALICALGLNSIVRCALRCGRRIAFETPEEAAARLAATGLKKRVLRRIPVEVFAPASSDPAMDCPICLGEFADGEKIRVLPKCNHRFHVRCIDTWLAAHSSCPTCRNSLLEKATKDGGEGRAEPGSVAVAVADEVMVRNQSKPISKLAIKCSNLLAFGCCAAYKDKRFYL